MHPHSAALLFLVMLPAADEPRQADLDALRAAHLAADGPSLVEFFHLRVPAQVSRARLDGLAARLGDPNPQVREQAAAELVGLGPLAVPALRRLVRDLDHQTRAELARCCLRAVEGPDAAGVVAAAARLVAVRRPEGAAEALLAYVPFADDEHVIEEVAAALAAVADGKARTLLIKSLDDPVPVRRGVAAQVLCRACGTDGRAAARRLLADPKPQVRLRAALGLVEAHDKAGVPALIDLLGDLPPERLGRAEELLVGLAGEKAPSLPLGQDAASRRRCRDAWAGWWREHGDGLDLAKLLADPPSLGLTLLVELNRGTVGRVREIGKDGTMKWQIENLQYPLDAQVVGADRVLVAEYRRRRVAEFNFKGEVVWEHASTGTPVGAQRLANGNTFIVLRNQLLEVDRDGKEVFTYPRPSPDLVAARKLRDGQIVFVTSGGTLIRLDPKGKEVKSFPVGPVQMFGGFEALAGGHVLLPLYSTNRVAEYDAEGKVVWQADVQQPTTVVRLPNGNTLVGSLNTGRIVELDRAGKVVWEQRGEGRVARVRRR